MISNRELDALIAEKVMGKDLCKCTDEQISEWKKALNPNPWQIGTMINVLPRFASDSTCNRCGKHYSKAKCYSTEIAAAWEVVEKMTRDGWLLNLEREDHDYWEVMFGHFEKDAGNTKFSKSAPMAICIAALSALGIDIDVTKKDGI